MWSNDLGPCQKITLALQSSSSREQETNSHLTEHTRKTRRHFLAKKVQAPQDFEWEHGGLGNQDNQRDRCNSVSFNNEQLKAIKNMWKSLVFIYIQGAKRRLDSESSQSHKILIVLEHQILTDNIGFENGYSPLE